MKSQPTVSERARARATQHRLRAIYKLPKPGTDSIPWYKVFNLSNGHVHKVYRADLTGMSPWRCTCPTQGQRCMHIQRVLDREEARIKAEELQTAASYMGSSEYGEGYEDGPDDGWV